MSNLQQRSCFQCGAPLDGNASSCKFCGAEIAQPQPQQHVQQPQHTQQTQQYTYQQSPQQYSYQPAYSSGKSKTVAGVLAILLGGLGIHKFYLRRPVMGIIYILFCWTYIPSIIGAIEGIVYLSSSEQVFEEKYARKG